MLPITAHTTMKICITGTHTRGMTLLQRKWFEWFLNEHKDSIHVLYHGDCVGVDGHAHDIVRELVPNCRIEIHPCNLPDRKLHANKKGDGEPNPERPPLERNKTMVKKGTVVVAFPRGSTEMLRSGTWATIRAAKKAKKELYIVWPEPTHHVDHFEGTTQTITKFFPKA